MDDRQFAELYDTQAERLLVFFTRRTLDAQTALDLWAETLAAAFAARRRCRATDPEGRASWLYGIAYKRLADLLRRGRCEQRALRRLGLEVPVASEQELERLEELAEVSALRADVLRALGELPAEQREAVRLRVVDELPYPEVARRLRVAEPTARARVSRGLRALRLRLTQERSPA